MSLPRLPHSSLAKAKIAAKLTGRKLSKETREKMRAAALGRKHTSETKAKISAGRYPERRAQVARERRAKRKRARRMKKLLVAMARVESWRTEHGSHERL